MVDISPLTSGSPAGYVPGTSNLTPSTDSDTATIDTRRYTQFDRSATETGTTTLSFSDFIDMVNPLQHIPVVSSVYRAITGDTINPVSRIVGDIAFSGPLGIASAAISGVGAIANSVMENQTGSDTTGNILASLFGNDSPASPPDATQLAESGPDAVKAQEVPTALAAAATLPVQTVNPTDKTAPSKPAKPVIAVADSNATSDTSRSIPAGRPAGKLLPLDRTRVFSGDPASAANNIESQDRLIALSEGSHTMRVGHMIYTNPLMNGTKPMPPGSTTPKTAAALANNSSDTSLPPPSLVAAALDEAAAKARAASVSAAPPVPDEGSKVSSDSKSDVASANNALPPALFDDVMILKRLKQYKDFATAPVTNGATLDYTN